MEKRQEKPKTETKVEVEPPKAEFTYTELTDRDLKLLRDADGIDFTLSGPDQIEILCTKRFQAVKDDDPWAEGRSDATQRIMVGGVVRGAKWKEGGYAIKAAKSDLVWRSFVSYLRTGAKVAVIFVKGSEIDRILVNVIVRQRKITTLMLGAGIKLGK